MKITTRFWIALTAAALLLGFAGGWMVRGWREAAHGLKAAKAEVRASTQVVASTQHAAAITQDVGQAVEVRQDAVRTITREILKEVPVYVTVQADRQCSVPVGFVRLHDAAAQGAAPALPDRAGQSADDPSGLALSAVAATVTDNYGVANELREQVLGWQAWYRAQQDAWGKAAPPTGGASSGP
jgi:hypothetical protein